MKLIQRILTKSGCYRAGRKIAVKGLMIHSVGCPQPKASAFISNWDKADAGACVHAIVEPGGDVYQLLPWDYRGWHCGGDANGTHIGVDDGACHDSVYGRCELDGDRGREEYGEPCACRL